MLSASYTAALLGVHSHQLFIVPMMMLIITLPQPGAIARVLNRPKKLLLRCICSCIR